MIQNFHDCFTLQNGVQIPCIGFGTWDLPADKGTYQAVTAALDASYRHLDCAALYGNQKSVGEALQASGIPRAELFINSKLWNTDRGYEQALKAFDKSLDELGLDYLDMYLIHWPATPKQRSDWREINAETWRAFENLYRDGRVRAIGVSNFKPHHLQALIEDVTILPMVNQVEYHPGEMQAETVAFCARHNIQVEAWSPLGEGLVLQNAALQKLAVKYQRSVAQIVIRWCLQNEVLPLPRSTSAAHIADNADVFDFELEASDIEQINALSRVPELRACLDPDEVEENFM